MDIEVVAKLGRPRSHDLEGHGRALMAHRVTETGELSDVHLALAGLANGSLDPGCFIHVQTTPLVLESLEIGARLA
jgi:hypothetical protein